MELIIAIIGLLIVLAYLMINSETWVFKLLLLGLLVVGFSTLAGVAYQESNCDLLVNNTSSTIDRVCVSDPNPESEVFVSFTMWVSRLLMIYIVGNLLYQLLESLNRLPGFVKRINAKRRRKYRRGGDDR